MPATTCGSVRTARSRCGLADSRAGAKRPNYTFFGGNSEMRGYDYREFIGHKAFYANAELRFPMITAMATPLGVLGGIRGVFFAQHRRRGPGRRAFHGCTTPSRRPTRCR